MIQTPCIGICSTVYGDDVCRGCKRRFPEVANWNGFKDDEKLEIWERLNSQAAQSIDEVVTIIDEAEFYNALERFMVRQKSHHQPAFLVVNLLRQAADQIDSVEELGLKALMDLPPGELMQFVDDRFYEMASK